MVRGILSIMVVLGFVVTAGTIVVVECIYNYHFQEGIVEADLPQDSDASASTPASLYESLLKSVGSLYTGITGTILGYYFSRGGASGAGGDGSLGGGGVT